MDHHDHDAVDGPWAGGWFVAVVAGLLVAILARLLGEVGMTTAFVLGALVFGVFGVLLGSGGVEMTSVDHGDDHSTGHP